MRLLPSSSRISAAAPRAPNSSSGIARPGSGCARPTISASTTSAVGAAIACGPGGQNRPRDCEIEPDDAPVPRLVTSNPPIVAALQAATNFGGRPVTLTTAPVSPVSMCTSERHDVRHGRGGCADNDGRHARFAHGGFHQPVCFGPAKTSGADACTNEALHERESALALPFAVGDRVCNDDDVAAGGGQHVGRGGDRGVVPSIGPDCLMSSALPAATCGASSTNTISPTLVRSARRCAIALPIGPAPTITTRAIARILVALEVVVYRALVTGGTRASGGRRSGDSRRRRQVMITGREQSGVDAAVRSLGAESGARIGSPVSPLDVRDRTAVERAVAADGRTLWRARHARQQRRRRRVQGRRPR